MSAQASLLTSWKGIHIGYDLSPLAPVEGFLPAAVMTRRSAYGIPTLVTASKSYTATPIGYGPLLSSPVTKFLLAPVKMILCGSGKFVSDNALRHYRDIAPV